MKYKVESRYKNPDKYIQQLREKIPNKTTKSDIAAIIGIILCCVMIISFISIQIHTIWLEHKDSQVTMETGQGFDLGPGESRVFEFNITPENHYFEQNAFKEDNKITNL